MSKVTRLHPVTNAGTTVATGAGAPAPQAQPLHADGPPAAVGGSWLAQLASSDPGHDPVLNPEDHELPPDVGADVPSAAPVVSEVQVPPAAPEAPSQPPVMSASEQLMGRLEAQMRDFDVAALANDDASVRERAEEQWRRLLDHAVRVDRALDGVADAAKRTLPGRLAAQVGAALKAAEAHRNAALTQGEGGANERPRAGHGGEGGSGIGAAMDSLIRSPLTLLQAGGALMLGGARKAHAAANQVLGNQRKSAYDVVARQVKSVAADIEADAQWLRAHGMEQVVNELKASGLAPSEAVAEMERGGKLERLGFQAKGVLNEPDVAKRIDQLNANLKSFAEKSQRLVKAGHVADLDSEAVIEPALKQVGDALEGMPALDKEGKLEMLGEKVREVAEKIRELIQRLVDKILPRP